MPRALVALIAFALPLLFAAPVVYVIHRQTLGLAEAERVLGDELQRLGGELGEVAGMDRAKAMLLARKVVIEAIDESRPDLAALLNVLGTLPPSVRLDRVEIARSSVTLGGTGAGAAAAVQALEAGRLAVGNVEQTREGFVIHADFGALSALDREPGQAGDGELPR